MLNGDVGAAEQVLETIREGKQRTGAGSYYTQELITEATIRSLREGDRDAALQQSAGLLSTARLSSDSAFALAYGVGALNGPQVRRASAEQPGSLGANERGIVSRIVQGEDVVIVGNGTPTSARLAQDTNVRPNAPPLRDLDRPVGQSPTQNEAAQADVRFLDSQGVKDIRINQQQLNSNECRVGICRPDVQGTLPDGRRIYIEYDRFFSNRDPGHASRILSNDPNAVIILRRVN